MKRYGLVLADNGSPWFFQGTADTALAGRAARRAEAIPASAFEAVDTSSLMISPQRRAWALKRDRAGEERGGGVVDGRVLSHAGPGASGGLGGVQDLFEYRDRVDDPRLGRHGGRWV